MPLAIPVEAVDFPTAQPATLPVDWNDLLWAAITVGRPNRYYVFRHGASSVYEAIFRASLIRMAVEESLGARRFMRTSACKTLDPSEKGAVNYFLGLTLCKFFASQQLGTPWLIHLDAFRTSLNPQLSRTERSRPDLVGRLLSGDWIAFEAKGRVSEPDNKTKLKAKDQARRIVSVNGQPVTGHYAGISYFKDESLRFFVQDPESLPEGHRRAMSLKEEEDQLFRQYYQPFTSIVRQKSQPEQATDVGRLEVVRVRSEEIDAELSIHPELLRLAATEQWAEMRRFCESERAQFSHLELMPDGLHVKAGHSWREKVSRSNSPRTEDE